MEIGSSKTVEESLVEAAAHVVDAPGMKAWNHGWFLPEYRASDLAALQGAASSVTIAPAGRGSFELAVRKLGKEARIRERWDADELWGVVASLVVAAAASDDPAGLVARGLHRMRSAGTTLVLVAVANVLPPDTPARIADSIIAQVGEPFRVAVNECASGRPTLKAEELARLSATYGANGGQAVACASWSPGQSQRAVQHAENRLRTILELALLLEPKPDRLGLYSLRGSTNRPGLRGVTVHRPALEDALASSGASAELAAEIALVTSQDVRRHVHWHSADPMPLEPLVGSERRRSLIERCITGASPVTRRLHVAARWYAEAHWAISPDDATLALGVAMDALIGSRSGLPGRAMRERFALLEPNAVDRAARAERYMEIFSERSAVAHGGATASAEEPGFVRAVAADVVWATYRMLAFEERFSPTSDKAIDAGFEQLRWGTAAWS